LLDHWLLTFIRERGSSEASGRKQRSLNFILGPPPNLFQFNIELYDIFHAKLRVEFWDDTTNELLSFAILAVRDLFELNFGLNEFSDVREMQPSDMVVEVNDAHGMDRCCAPTPLKWIRTLGKRTPRPLTSPATTPGKQNGFEQVVSSPKNPIRFGTLRLTGHIVCNEFVVDLLRQPEINLVIIGFQIVLRILQFSDPQVFHPKNHSSDT
jgi:hypothetical protein